MSDVPTNETPFFLKVKAEFWIVVDLAIVGEHPPAVCSQHRLMPGRRQVDDREPTMPECYATFRPDSTAIRPPMQDGRQHAFGESRVGTFSVPLPDSYDSTHRSARGPCLGFRTSVHEKAAEAGSSSPAQDATASGPAHGRHRAAEP